MILDMSGVPQQPNHLKCPKCGASLPKWAQACQFCQTDVSKISRPVNVVHKKHYDAFDTPKWIWACYYFIAAWWILGGMYEALDSMYVFGKPLELLKLEKEFGFKAGPQFIGVISGALTFIFGLGLALKIELIRGIVNFVAGLKLIFGLLGLAGSLMGMTFAGFLSLPFVILNLVDIITAGMLLWLIGETDMGPNW